MEKYYNSEKNVQILIALLKAYGIKKVIASPGTTNISFIGSIQNDPWFEIYSSVDERSAAYIACGLAAESGEPVVLSCTGATASRNYISGLTEAFYRKLPILAVTSTQHIGRVGNNIPQVIDRSQIQKDIAKLSIQLPMIYCEEDRWAAELNINKALIELRDNGGGPVHINLATTYSMDFSVKSLPKVKVIKKFTYRDKLPDITGNKVGIFVGAHKEWSSKLIDLVDKFCSRYNGVVFCDHTSNYKGKYYVNASLICSQPQRSKIFDGLDILIDIGDISGAYMGVPSKQVWRVNRDGEIRDAHKRLTNVFEMREEDFFEYYVQEKDDKDKDSYLKECQLEYERLLKKIPELPFSNVWIAQNSVKFLPKGSVLHLGILNTLRAWNFFKIPKEVLGYSNTGGFGIDGITSSLVGASLSNKEKLYFGVLGDLAFFYDLNVLGNHHLGNNIRIMLINNGRGTEFRNYNHNAAQFGEEADKFMAAAGHFGNKSKNLVRNFVQDLGFEYITAKNKIEYLEKANYFFNEEIYKKPIVFEVFTDSINESNAIKIMRNLETTTKGKIKKILKKVLGTNKIEKLKKYIKK
jgi:2-succinyl-5-enolpyruvyl-6-hydroxy-3-cyclohexene-1-carboxylate synthase